MITGRVRRFAEFRETTSEEVITFLLFHQKAKTTFSLPQLDTSNHEIGMFLGDDRSATIAFVPLVRRGQS